MRIIVTFIASLACLFLTSCVPQNEYSHVSNKAQHMATLSPKKVVTYRVFGKSYKVLASSKNYQEQGTASWYGPGFNHKYTSSGERFNMYSMTAAHKSLPLKTKVVVTNLLNGKQVVVKVNDRGPFVSNRLIDLSYAAAKKLGMVGRGVAPVQVKAIA